jgi:hypothetical protein
MSALFSTSIGSLPPSSALTGVSVSALLRGPVRAGELDEVDLVDQRRAGLTHPVDHVEHVGAADLTLPGLDDLGDSERGHLGRLDHDRRSRLQSGERVAQREDQGEVPRTDHADDGEGPVDDLELLHLHHR